jgi:nitrite reductase (NADH) small subunit/3-phenylpropionate/trans-cinnamate dioxygenase ferredoxin subunit
VTEVRAGSLADLTPGQPRVVEIAGTAVVLARVGDQVHALGARCRHRGGPLGEGRLSGARLACPWHGWMYDVRTGQCLFPARGEAVASFPVRLAGDDVWVALP